MTCDTKKQTLFLFGQDGGVSAGAWKNPVADVGGSDVCGYFGNDGQLYMPLGVVMASDNKSLGVSAKGGEAQINSLEAYELKIPLGNKSSRFSI